MKRKMLVYLIISFLVSSAIFSASINSVSPQIPTRTIPAIVSTEWLAANLNLPNLVILDVRSSDLYSAGHIPGAINVPEAQWYINPPFGDAFPWMEMPSTQQLFSLIGSAGITKDSLVVIVGGTSGPLSPMPLALYSCAGITRVALALLYAGVTNVSILDGGYDKWAAEGKPISAVPKTPTPTTYTGTVNSGMIVSKSYVASKIGSAIIIDARDLEVYLGFVQEPWTNRTGHIPTARSLPTPWLWAAYVNQTTGDANYIVYQSEDVLSGLASLIVGSDVSREIIVYCGVGGYASTMYFILSEVLGYRNVKVYDGSAQEWSFDQTLPIISEDLGSEYLNLYGNYAKLQSNYTHLSENYNALESSYEALEQNYTNLSSRITKLESDYSKLSDNYNKLKSDYEELQSDYDELVKTTMPSYLTFIFVVTTVILLIVAVYLAVKLRARKG